MSVKFNVDISIDDLNLPPLDNYAVAERLINTLKIGNFNKKYWGRLKHKVSDDERVLNQAMRKNVGQRNYGKRPIEVNYTKVTERDNVYWFRPSECFANVIVPVFMLNDGKSASTDRYQIIVNSYHAAIYDMEESIIYDPTIDTINEIGANYTDVEKKTSILGLLLTNTAISVQRGQLVIGTLSLTEYLNNFHCGKTNKPLREFFNEALGREAIKADNIGSDLRKTF